MALNYGRTVCTAAALCVAAGTAWGQVVDYGVPLNYNFHGMAQTTEAVTGAGAANADVVLFRAISDRGLYWDHSDSHAFGSLPLVGNTGLVYGLFDSLGYSNETVTTAANAATWGLDCIHLGERGVWNRQYDTNNTTTNGPFPAWEPDGNTNHDHTGDQVTVLATPVLVDAQSEIGVLYMVSDSGGQFDCVLRFNNGATNTDVTVRLGAPDWFGNATDPVVASRYVSSQKKMTHTVSGTTYTTFRGVQNVDSAQLQTFSTTNAGPNLNVMEGLISVAKIIQAGTNVAGQNLTRITFKNATYGITSMSAVAGSGTLATATVTSTTGYVAGQPIEVRGLSVAGLNGTYTINSILSGTQFTYTNGTTAASTTAQMYANGLALSTLTGSGTTETGTTAAAHGFTVGQDVTIGGASTAAHNGTFSILTVPTSTTFTYAVPAGATSTAQRQVVRLGVGRGYSIYSVTARAGHPTRSNCATPQVVTAGDTVSDNFHADDGRTTPCGGGADNTGVWYAYTATSSGVVEARTCGDALATATGNSQVTGVSGVSSAQANGAVTLPFDSTMAVYASCAAGTPIACNDDGCSVASKVQWTATAGNTYLIRIAGKAGATGTFTLHIDGSVHTDIPMPLLFNWNGINHGNGERTLSDPATQGPTTGDVHENRADLNGYRSIADRGLLCDGTTNNALNYGSTTGYQGMTYTIYATQLQADMIHLGNRAAAASGSRNWSATGTAWPHSNPAGTATTDNGLRPFWLNQDQQDAQTSSMASLSAVFGASTRIGFLYHISNVDTLSGTTPRAATFDVTLNFHQGVNTFSTVVTVQGSDWYGGTGNAPPYNQVLPNPTSGSGVEVQRVLGIYHGVQNTDRGSDAVGTNSSGALKVEEAVISTQELINHGFDPTGMTLDSITFGNMRSGNAAQDNIYSAVGIYAAVLRDPASYNLNFGPGGVGTVSPNQLPVGGTGLMTVTTSRGSGAPNNIATVTVDESSLFGNPAGTNIVTLNDSGTGGDAHANDGTWSTTITFTVNSNPGAASLPFTVTDGQSRTATGNIIFSLVAPAGSVTPNPVLAGTQATVSTDLSTVSNLSSVVLDATSIGAGMISLHDDGVAPDTGNHNGTWAAFFTVPANATAGPVSLPLVLTDTTSHTGSGAVSFTINAPPTATDLGTLADGVTTVDDTININEIKWVKFTLTNPVNAGVSRFLDIDSENSLLSPSNDVEIGLYDFNGNLIATDDDDGSNLLAQLSFGVTNPARAAVGNGVAYDGRDGALPAGTYYLAYAGFNSVFNATGWSVTSPSTNTGSIHLNIALGTVPAGGVPTQFTDLGTIGSTPISDTETLTAGGVQWFKFIVATTINGANPTPRQYIDIDTENSTIIDTTIGLFRDDGSGTLVASDDDSGSSLWSQLTFGRGTRPAPGDGAAYDGRNGLTLAAGTYYLAVCEHQASFGNNFVVFFRTGTSSAPVTVNIRSGVQSPFIYGPVVNPSNSHSYYLMASGFSFTDAEAWAETVGGTLATIDDADENNWVQFNVLRYDGNDRRGWIGLNDAAATNTYVWLNNEPVNYFNWSAGEPSHSGGTEHYVEMLGNGLWNDLPLAGAAGGDFGLVEIGQPPCVADVDDGSGTGTRDGGVTIDDLLYYLFLFANGDIAADVDDGSGTGTHDQGVTIDDLLYFLLRFSIGC